MKNILSKENRLKENFYVVKSMMKPLDLWYQKIDMCLKFYMLYYLENTELTECGICGLWHMIYRGNKNFRWRQLWYRLSMIFLCIQLMGYSWSTHEKLAYPYCMKNNKTFTLINGGKASFYYCHRWFLSTDNK
jgi:hypothetical protein